MSKKGEYIKLKNYETKANSSFTIYADFESMLAPENNGKQDPHESYTNTYQEHVACSYSYKLLYADDQLSQLLSFN